MKKLLIRADDLGYSRGVNYGIADSLKGGLLKTVGVMVNMPATVHGLDLLKGMDLCLGQHTNITAGKPITNPSKIPSITTSDGFFRSSTEYRQAKEDFVVLDEVVLEIEAQYERFCELTGEQPRYFEGHAVASENYFRGLKIVAERHGLRHCDMDLGFTEIQFDTTRILIHMEGMLPNYNPVEAIVRAANVETDACNMYVCHPGYLDAYILQNSTLTMPRVYEVEALCSTELRERLEELDVKLITLDDLPR
ncbi:MAG: ChbG/HpnK family deacetylase [Bifidobacteriaceae bacterium]|jgi:predicted glycoside hydrolase/deacetylase ChbG (UPF0249 family)|nr:ChbG/HpnK family deacetylase [Bifidobacteriaceae bacterium]